MQYRLPFAGEKSPPAKPLSCQLLKWVGNKQRVAAQIVGFFPARFGTYWEPFLGSGAVLGTLAPRKGVGADVFPPLMEIWLTLKRSPETLIRWYRERWEQIPRLGKEEAYRRVQQSYNRSPNGADLLFLCRACYGGVVRFRKADGGMSTPCGAHMPISPEQFARRVRLWHPRVHHTDFLLQDFRETMEMAQAGDVVYCDPPYQDSQSILYGAQEFSLDDLFEAIARCKRRGVYVALSIDGVKRSGKKDCRIDVPPGLFQREIFLDCGRSMLRRFQMKGHSLEGEEVRDRLLLTF